MTGHSKPPHHGHDIASIDGCTYCEDCHVDLTDREVCALERHDRLEALACLSENEKAIHDTLQFFVEEGLVPALSTAHRGMGGAQALQRMRDALVLKRKNSELAESEAVAMRRVQQKLLGERIYERMVAALDNTTRQPAVRYETLRVLRATAEAAAAVWMEIQ